MSAVLRWRQQPGSFPIGVLVLDEWEGIVGEGGYRQFTKLDPNGHKKRGGPEFVSREAAEQVAKDRGLPLEIEADG